MTITAIKAQLKNSQRVSVYVDGVYQFSLNHAQLLEQKLRIGLPIDDARLAELKKASDFGKAYERVLNFVTIRPRSVREVQDYCRRKQWPPADCQIIIEKLQARRHLDDAIFAKAWVDSRQATKAVSARRLYMELKQKGVSENLIAATLEQSGYSEDVALRALIAKKRRLPRYAHDRQKLMQYLARQGFAYDDIRTALDE